MWRDEESKRSVLILKIQLNLEIRGFRQMDQITQNVMEKINTGGTFDSTTATVLLADFGEELFDHLWTFIDENILGVESKDCFLKTKYLEEIFRPDLHKNDYVRLIPKSCDEGDCLDFCMCILLL